MTDNMTPELTLTPNEDAATATAAAVPELTLEPQAPVTPATPAEAKPIEPVVLDDSMLTAEEKAAVDNFAKKIDIRDTNQVL